MAGTNSKDCVVRFFSHRRLSTKFVLALRIIPDKLVLASHRHRFASLYFSWPNAQAPPAVYHPSTKDLRFRQAINASRIEIDPQTIEFPSIEFPPSLLKEKLFPQQVEANIERRQNQR